MKIVMQLGNIFIYQMRMMSMLNRYLCMIEPKIHLIVGPSG
ncbi:hypothetical protein LEP1GSC062_2012 [Leptospira alexanderi serovar Manhao 3 str. L 60]|uniref:Uncharacterized protein n=1 Tax=Leptospira alexanderi serovar Manhao 3 str. L 60 TaxID=1049759 RepID=V6I314_9LEPT|nr:hypothetical protein LEP1GSC062_2012 [Leptospira alexanderi serovar Manhao 3 str. L 60]